MPITGTELKKLYIDTITFKLLPEGKKAVFRLFLDAGDNLTLAVWTSAGTDYDTEPLFFLKPGTLSGFKWGANTFFGDQKLGNAQIKAIKHAIKPDTPDVIFVPRKHDTLVNQIAFDVSVGTHTFDQDFTVVATTNPSPPRNSGVS